MRKTASSRYEMDMTRGPMLPSILKFSIPLILSGVLQLLYNAADVVVVGRFAGAQSLAAVGSTTALINLLINLFIGLSMGASVITSRDFGAHDDQNVHKDVHTAVTIGLLGGILLAAVGGLAAKPLLELMGSPEDVIDLAALYVRIFFLGMPFNLLYNFGAAELRAVGDTKRPLYFLMISGLFNVLLNLLLVIVFHMDVAGVAIATIASQAISMVLVLQALMRSESSIRLDLRTLRLHRRALKEILRMGVPAGLQSSLFSFSNVLIQSSINSFGSLVMAGNSAASSIEGFVYTSMNAIAQADMTFAGQNMGAGKYSRVRRCVLLCCGTVTVVGCIVGGAAYLAGRPLLALYNTDPEVISYGLIRLHLITSTYFLCGLMDVMSCHMRGIGCSLLPMIVSLSGACLLRIVWILTIFQLYRTTFVLYLSYPITWIITTAVHIICYLIVKRKLLPAVDAVTEDA